MKKIKMSLVAVAFATLSFNNLQADTLSNTLKSKNMSVGIQTSLPSIGLSVRSDISDKINLQGVLGFFGNVNTYLIRGNYKLTQDEIYHTYGFASVGMWTYDYSIDTETALGFGLGGGVEFDMQSIDENLPPVTGNIEIAFSQTGIEHYNISALTLGFGVHYKF